MNDFEKAEAIVGKSGNRFHSKVVNYLKYKGWTVKISPYYFDGSTNKPREIDIVAEKTWPYSWLGSTGNITIRLFVECKYIPNVNVFWFSGKDRKSTMSYLKNISKGNTHFRFLEQHHYLKTCEETAKLFDSSPEKALENEVIYKAINQSINAMVNLRQTEDIISSEEKNYPNDLYTLDVPIIMVNSFDKFFRTNIGGDGEVSQIDSNFELEVNYAYKDPMGHNRNDFFLIDVVEFNKIDPFLELIELDLEFIKSAGV